MYGFEGVGLSEVQLSISELSVVGGWVVVGGGGGRDKRTSWSDLVGVRQKENAIHISESDHIKTYLDYLMSASNPYVRC